MNGSTHNAKRMSALLALLRYLTSKTKMRKVSSNEYPHCDVADLFQRRQEAANIC